MEPITIIPETIAVKGGDAGARRRPRHAPRTAGLGRDQRELNAARARHPKPPPLDPLAFRWTALDAERYDRRRRS